MVFHRISSSTNIFESSRNLKLFRCFQCILGTSFPIVSVRLLVNHHIVALVEGFVTDVAREWFFASVYPCVDGPIAPERDYNFHTEKHSNDVDEPYLNLNVLSQYSQAHGRTVVCIILV